MSCGRTPTLKQCLLQRMVSCRAHKTRHYMHHLGFVVAVVSVAAAAESVVLVAALVDAAFVLLQATFCDI